MGRAHSYWADYESSLGKDPVDALENARERLHRALELDPQSPEIYVALGVTFRIEGTWLALHGNDSTSILQRALESYETATLIDPDYSSAHLSRAVAELHLGDYLRRRGEDPQPYFENAIAAGKRTVELEPQLVGGHVNLGIAYEQMAIFCRDQGSRTKAEAYFGRGSDELRQAIELNPEFYTAHFNLGELLVEHAELVRSRGDDPSPYVTESSSLLELAITAWPDWPPPHSLLARGQTLLALWSMSSGGDPSVALARGHAWTESGFAIGSDPVGLLIAARLKLAEGRWRLDQGEDPLPSLVEVRELASRSSKTSPGIADVHWARGESYWIEGRWMQETGDDPRPSLRAGLAEVALAQEANAADPRSFLLLARLQACWASWQKSRGDNADQRVIAGLSAIEEALSIHAESVDAKDVHEQLLALLDRTDRP